VWELSDQRSAISRALALHAWIRMDAWVYAWMHEPQQRRGFEVPPHLLLPGAHIGIVLCKLHTETAAHASILTPASKQASNHAINQSINQSIYLSIYLSSKQASKEASKEGRKHACMHARVDSAQVWHPVN
jgi:hypothetical protein